jgi:hypothetical protein
MGSRRRKIVAGKYIKFVYSYKKKDIPIKNEGKSFLL